MSHNLSRQTKTSSVQNKVNVSKLNNLQNYLLSKISFTLMLNLKSQVKLKLNVTQFTQGTKTSSVQNKINISKRKHLTKLSPQ